MYKLNYIMGGESVKKVPLYLDYLLYRGYFYNGEWVYHGKIIDDICLEFEHFLAKRKKYIWIKKRLHKRRFFWGKRIKQTIAYISDTPPYCREIRMTKEEESSCVQGILQVRGIGSVSGCWQMIWENAFSDEEYFGKSRYSLCREIEDICSTDSETRKYWCGEYMYEDLSEDANQCVEFNYLYIVKIAIDIKKFEEASLMQNFIRRMEAATPIIYIMRTDQPQEQILLPDGITLKMNAKRRKGYVTD